MNYFDLYGIPKSFNPDPNLVKQRFEELSNHYRSNLPDGVGDAVPEEIPSVLLQVNDAYRIFKSRDETMAYVLQLYNLIKEEEHYPLPPAFLKEAEEIGHVLTTAKIDNDHEQIQWVKSEVIKLNNAIYNQVEGILEDNKGTYITSKALLQVKEYYYMKKYLNRILAGMK